MADIELPRWPVPI